MAIQIRRGTESAWNSNKSNIVAGEPAIATDTGRLFVGTGTGTYAEFPNTTNTGVRNLGQISAGNSKTITIPSSHFCLIVLHGVYASLTAILEVYCNSSGTVSVRLMAVPSTATQQKFTTSTATNSLTISNTDSSGSIATIEYIGTDSGSITTS